MDLAEIGKALLALVGVFVVVVLPIDFSTINSCSISFSRGYSPTRDCRISYWWRFTYVLQLV
jgi:hypothetical protein